MGNIFAGIGIVVWGLGATAVGIRPALAEEPLPPAGPAARLAQAIDELAPSLPEGAPPRGRGPSATPPVGKPGETEAEAAGSREGHSTVAMLAPTGNTPPAGTVSVSSVEVVFVGVSVSPTRWLSLSAMTLPSVLGEGFVGGIQGKLQVYRSPKFRAALHAISFYENIAGSTLVAGVGGAATSCVDPQCTSFFNLYLGAGVLRDAPLDRGLDWRRGTAISFAMAARLSERSRLLLELGAGTFIDDDERGDGLLGLYGIRLTTRHAACDFGFALPLTALEAIAYFPLGIPVLRLSLRT